MQAIVTRAHGGPEVLGFETVPDPVARSGDAVVELRYCALNNHDVFVREGSLPIALPRILGIDGAGIRRDTGESVVILPSMDWGDDRRRQGIQYHVLGDRIDGTYAQLVAVPQSNLFPKPARLSWAEAAALPVAGLTAYRALFTRARLGRGETLVVLGAGSGVSTFVVSLGVAAGATVLVTSSSAEKIGRAIELGAAGGVNYTRDGWVKEVIERTGGGADVVIDAVGADHESSLQCAAPGGRVVVFGAQPGTHSVFDTRRFFLAQQTLLGTTLGDATDFAELLALIDHSSWRPVIDSKWNLEDMAEAHRYLASGQHFGKVVVDCQETVRRRREIR